MASSNPVSGTAVPLVMKRLNVTDLHLSPKDPLYDDAVACIEAYRKQASEMTEEEQLCMIRDIKNKRFLINRAARKTAADHRLYRQISTSHTNNTWGAHLILRALYKYYPNILDSKLTVKFGDRRITNQSSKYYETYRATVRPMKMDKSSASATAFKRLYPSLKNVPYWARMGLDEPHTPRIEIFRGASVEFGGSEANNAPSNNAVPSTEVEDDSDSSVTFISSNPVTRDVANTNNTAAVNNASDGNNADIDGGNNNAAVVNNAGDGNNDAAGTNNADNASLAVPNDTGGR